MPEVTALNAGYPIVGDTDLEGFSGRGGDRFDELAKQKIPTVTDAVRALIEQSQPYYTGGEFWTTEPLWILHELARVDRHRFLHPAVVMTHEVRLDPATLRNVKVRDFESTWGERILEEPGWDEDGTPPGAVLATFTALPAAPKKEMKMKPLAELTLGFDIDNLPPTLAPLRRDEIERTLWYIEFAVSRIFERLTPHLSASP